MITTSSSTPDSQRHRPWVRVSHWVITLSFLALLYTGVVILMCHPRLYWGEVGNDLTPALIELPISRNYKHGGWDDKQAFFQDANSPISASRTYDIWNKNGWGRSLHFLSAWFLVGTGLIYLVFGVVTAHFKRNLLPANSELTKQSFLKDVVSHVKMQMPAATDTPHYGLLQKFSYLSVVFFLMPLIILTGLTMSPAVAAAYPFLLKIFAGAQSARTIHFFATIALVLFLFVHVVMIVITGFRQHMRSMTIGK